MRDIKTEGFILKRIPYQNENVKLFSVFTKDFGKITLSSRTSKKIQSSLNSLSPLNICEIEIYKSSTGFFKAKKITLKKSFIEIQELEILQKLYVMAEVIHKIIEENHPEPLLYELLIKSALILEHIHSDLIFETFKTKFFKISGTLPNLKYCFTCQTKSSDDANWITHDNVHIYCQKCLESLMTDSKYSQISLHALKLLHFIADASLDKITQLHAPMSTIQEVAHINELLLNQLLQKKLQTQTHALTN